RAPKNLITMKFKTKFVILVSGILILIKCILFYILLKYIHTDEFNKIYDYQIYTRQGKNQIEENSKSTILIFGISCLTLPLVSLLNSHTIQVVDCFNNSLAPENGFNPTLNTQLKEDIIESLKQSGSDITILSDVDNTVIKMVNILIIDIVNTNGDKLSKLAAILDTIERNSVNITIITHNAMDIAEDSLPDDWQGAVDYVIHKYSKQNKVLLLKVPILLGPYCIGSNVHTFIRNVEHNFIPNKNKQETTNKVLHYLSSKEAAFLVQHLRENTATFQRSSIECYLQANLSMIESMILDIMGYNTYTSHNAFASADVEKLICNCDVGLSYMAQTNIKDAILKHIIWFNRMKKDIYPSKLNSAVFSTYFTSKQDPQRPTNQSTNNFKYFAAWYWSLQDVGMKGLIFYDNLDLDFKTRVANENVSFVKADLGPNSVNDARFYIYYEYVKNHPELKWVLFTDIADVKFLKNPFELMGFINEDLLYVGQDKCEFQQSTSNIWVNNLYKNCLGKTASEKVNAIHKQEFLYNAGIIGGSRSIILEFLHHMTEAFNEAPSDMNCDMGILNYVVHRYFQKRVFTGFPLHSYFRIFQINPKGVYIVHK
ncbi:unnamed protein product, partial [Owenia fusiformis]